MAQNFQILNCEHRFIFRNLYLKYLHVNKITRKHFTVVFVGMYVMYMVMLSLCTSWMHTAGSGV